MFLKMVLTKPEITRLRSTLVLQMQEEKKCWNIKRILPLLSTFIRQTF